MLDTGEFVFCERKRCSVRPPTNSEPRAATLGRRVSALCCAVRKKLTGVGPPSAPSWKWSGRGTWTEPLVLLTERSDVTVLCSKSWSECYRRSLLACRCLVVSPLRCCRVLPMAARACACPSSTRLIARPDLRPAASFLVSSSHGTCAKFVGNGPIGVVWLTVLPLEVPWRPFGLQMPCLSQTL